MVKALGIIFLGILITIPAVALSGWANNSFLFNFSQNQSISVLATILALNVAVVTFMMGTLLSIEAKADKTLFANTRKELLDNIIFMTVLFLINFTVVAANKTGFGFMANNTYFNVEFILSSLTVLIVVLTILAMYEIVRATFQVKNFFGKDSDGE